MWDPAPTAAAELQLMTLNGNRVLYANITDYNNQLANKQLVMQTTL